MNKENLEELSVIAVRIRGTSGVRKDIENTLKRLKLLKKNNCVLLKSTPDILGMLKKVKDFITWGIIDDETKKLLIEKRGKHDNKYFRLHPPRGGFGRKGIKKPFSVKGVLGDRKENINELIKKMI